MLSPGGVFSAGSSPHTRGARSSPTSHRSDGRIIPAYAGSTGDMAAQAAVPGDHPRIRGEHQCAGIRLGERSGSSPHTRGAPAPPPNSSTKSGIIPAYAGSTGLVTCISDAKRAGSSPHTRGAPIHRRRQRGERRIIPAYAGSTRRIPWMGRQWRDHPRIRGEHLIVKSGTLSTNGSSPHTRGARPHRIASAFRRRIIPAYAGSTPFDSGGALVGEDHPRIRGEHGPVDGVQDPRVGSSPHTRGARRRRPHPNVDRGIIPAYAGST